MADVLAFSVNAILSVALLVMAWRGARVGGARALRNLGIVFVLFSAVALLSSATLIQPGERAVVRRFGRVLEEKAAAGLHFYLPFGMDRIDRIKVNEVREV